jgi:hypothetical protein
LSASEGDVSFGKIQLHPRPHLLARSNEVNLIIVTGSISPLDLTHLGGPFGIPKIEGGVVVPNTAHR